MSSVNVTISNQIEIHSPPSALKRKIKKALSFPNPAYDDALNFGRTTRGISKKIRLYEDTAGDLNIPRGSMGALEEMFSATGFNCNITDKSAVFEPTIPPKVIKLWEYQTPWVEDLIKFKEGVGIAPPGCHRKGTSILMADGTLKNIEHVLVGDKVMGDTGFRQVEKLCRGRQEMYEVVPNKGESFFANRDHVLCLVFSASPKGRGYLKGQEINITVNDYLKLPKYIKDKLKLFRSPVKKFEQVHENIPLPIEPYFLGVLLGDGGLTGQVNVTSADKEIVEEVYRQATIWGSSVRVTEQEDNLSNVYHFKHKRTNNGNGYYSHSKLRLILSTLGLLGTKSGTKYVPHQYKIASIEDRLSLLAGLIDTDGSLSNNTFDYVSKSLQLAQDVCFLSRSCGMAANIAPKVVKGTTYWRVCISGDTDMIPVQIPRKKASVRRQKKNVLRTGFSVRLAADSEKYYGIRIDGNHRYLLSDFTVTHNSGKTLMALEMYARLGQPCLWITHTKRLARQVTKRLKEFLGVEAGLIGAGKEDIKHFTVGLVPTLVRRDLSKYKDTFGLIIVDEAHHVPASTFLKVISSFSARYRYGLTATPYREDKLEDLLFSVVGPKRAYLDKEVLRKLGKLVTPTVVRRPTNFYFPYNPTSRKHNYAALSDALAEDFKRNQQIATDVIVESTLNDQNVCIILVGRIPHGDALCEMIEPVLPRTGFVHSKMKTAESDQILDDFENGKLKVLIATYKMLAEGFDYQPSNRMFLTAPFKGRSLIEQAIGRIERAFIGKTSAIVYDYVDHRVGVLNRQADTRLDTYEINNNPVTTLK